MIINTSLSNGLFKADIVEFPEITESQITADIGGSKEPLAALVYLPDTLSAAYSFVCVNAPKNIISLEKGLNVIHLTSKGIANDYGIAEFNVVAKDGSSVSGKGIKVGFVKYTSVINH